MDERDILKQKIFKLLLDNEIKVDYPNRVKYENRIRKNIEEDNDVIHLRRVYREMSKWFKLNEAEQEKELSRIKRS